MSAFSSISSRSITSTRTGWSCSRVFVRVAVTMTDSSTSGIRESAISTGAGPWAVSTTWRVEGRCPVASALMSYSPDGKSNTARPSTSDITVRPLTTTDAPGRGRSSDTTSTMRIEGFASCASARRGNGKNRSERASGAIRNMKRFMVPQPRRATDPQLFVLVRGICCRSGRRPALRYDRGHRCGILRAALANPVPH